jgi:5-methylcytosine-specific restriction protein B
VDGIFKQLCLNARVKVQGSATQSISLKGRRIWKMSLGNTMGGEEDVYEDCLANNYVLLGWGEDIDFSNCSTYESVKARIASEKQSLEGTSNYMAVAVNTFKNIIKNGDYSRRL